jgi:vancomycin aglycone glucosyltransferase
MRVVLSTYGGRGDVEPLVGLAVALLGQGAEVLLCAPPDCADRVAEAGVPFRPVGPPVRPLVQGTVKVDVARRVAEVMGAQFDTLAPAAEGADVLVATGLFPATAGAQSVAERLGIRFVYAAYSPHFLPSPDNRPQPLPGRGVPAGVTDPARLNEIDVENYNAAFGDLLNKHRAAVGLPPVDNVRDQVITNHPWLAADPVLAPAPAMPGREVVQTGTWRVADDRPLPADLEAFLEAGPPPVYVGFGSMKAPAGIVASALAQGRRVLLGRGWSDLDVPGPSTATPAEPAAWARSAAASGPAASGPAASGPAASGPAASGPAASGPAAASAGRAFSADPATSVFSVGEVNQQALFPRLAAVVHHGGAGTTTTAARAGVPQVVVPQMADQPYYAGRVAALGIGVAHDGPAPTAASLSAALEEALAPAVRARGAEIAPTIRADGALAAARLLLS